MEKDKLKFLESLGLCAMSGCSSEENKTYTEMQRNNERLPEGIMLEFEGPEHNGYTKYSLKEYTDKDVYRLIEEQKLQKLNTIKNCVVFFTVITILGIAIMVSQMLG